MWLFDMTKGMRKTVGGDNLAVKDVGWCNNKHYSLSQCWVSENLEQGDVSLRLPWRESYKIQIWSEGL